MELFAGLIDLFKETRDVNGQSLFDTTLISYGSNLRTGHGLKGPAIYTGGAGEKLKRGEHCSTRAGYPAGKLLAHPGPAIRRAAESVQSQHRTPGRAGGLDGVRRFENTYATS